LNLAGQARQVALYAQDKWRPMAALDVTFGLRAVSYEATEELYWEPRASLRFELGGGFLLKGAWGLYNQFVKRVENEDVLEGSRDFWILADSVLPPQSAEHRIAGLAYETDDVLFDVEAYYKELDGVSQFSTRSRRAPGQAFSDLFFSGTGTARGVEVLAQKKRGALTGWVSYTLSEVIYDLEGFNDSQPFPASHDQRHELNLVGSYQLGPWVFSSTWIYGSGRAYTSPESQYAIELLDGTELSYIHVGAKNAERLPAYHRLDVAANRRFESDRLFYDFNVTLFNAYGRGNVWYRQFDLTQNPLIITDVKTLPFTFSIGASFGLKPGGGR